ncbi:ribonucleotide-diphosphate reductase subunit beta [Thermoflexus sp.]|uniref:ribonucleotide-diphosphate reductase subunit beta n=1 Tax=Thermoflexus sp. TaxID=1969742 RepID=UPI0025E6927E|nr:ribonucleotide-diphosphate reductase subunit beta [Thermoflexus sp.]MDW8065771.1 ribonucleotide-diphosphate reductase subunit beta [Anaerolineae bacterium]MCS6963858.1 ribonucleotide-diphosphate reductase subunit beta [Thermoflexus sp.]MCS7350244.1 ribonucleotide-diphosphate reductase subunit beta [Thermoflexus sp.]MCX7691445.1 ribonucleotide-diphosphate reductase subunit beta [Thermoflexus sp.]MDW8179695.1 ribonucleotide-diphosphate reductase subunit beta [Anaerolineae bacterium]
MRSAQGLFSSNPLEPMRLFPLRYPWAYAHVQQAKRNTWFPEEAPLQDDVQDWHERLSPEERHAVEILLGFFNPMESMVTSNLLMALYPYLTAPEIRLYLVRQAWEEANHTMAFEYVIKTLPVDRERVFGMLEDHPAVAAKAAFQRQLTAEILQPGLDLSTPTGRRRFLRNLVGFFVVLEGIFFYSGFAFALSFRRRNLLRGLNTIIDWVLKDESLHLSFGIHLIQAFLQEHPEVRTEDMMEELREMILEAVSLEENYNRSLLPQPILGMHAELLNGYVRYVADRRMEELGIGAQFHSPNPLRWLAIEIDLPEQVNFFEARNVNYEIGRPRQ